MQLLEVSMFDKLVSGVCYVTFVFDDGTRQTIHTTLNEEILRKSGAVLKPDFLFDLDRLRYIGFRRDADEVLIDEEKPQVLEEVLRFANRFI